MAPGCRGQIEMMVCGRYLFAAVVIIVAAPVIVVVVAVV